jgi:hypothetical protein
MRPIFVAVIAAFLIASGSASADQSRRMTDDEVAEILIEQSISRYPGTCACPYNTMRNGRRCGGRSAYSKPGGYSPLCYREDVSDSDIARYRKAKSLAKAQ